MTKKSFSYNLIITFLTQFLTLFGGFIISILYARLLGADGRGMIVALLVAPTIVATLGRLGVKRSIAYSLGKNLYSKNQIYTSALILWIFTSVISVSIVAVYYFGVLYPDYHWSILAILLIMIPFQFLVNYSDGFLEGQEKITNINKKRILEKLSEIAGILIFISILALDVLGAAMTQVFLFLSVSVYSLYCIKKFNEFSRISWDYNFTVIKYLVTGGIQFAIPFLLFTLLYRADILMLERMVSIREVGIYSIGVTVAQLLWQLPTAINIVLFSRSLNTKAPEESVKRTTQLLRIVTPFILIAGIILYFISDIVILAFYGIEFKDSTLVLKILLPGIIIIVISKIIHADLQGQGHPMFAVGAFSLPLILNIVLNILLIPNYSIYGAALASTLSYILGTLTITYMYKRKYSLTFKQIFVMNYNDFLLIKNKFIILLRLNK